MLLSAAVEERYAALYVLAVTAGLRRGELLGLMWDDIDLGRGTMQVRRTLQKGEMLPPKTAKSRRQIRLTRRAVDALRWHWRNQETERALADGTWTEHGLVFPNRVDPSDPDAPVGGMVFTVGRAPGHEDDGGHPRHGLVEIMAWRFERVAPERLRALPVEGEEDDPRAPRPGEDPFGDGR